MKKLAILVPEGITTFSSLILTIEVIQVANKFFLAQGKSAVFETLLIGSEQEQADQKCSFQVRLDRTISDNRKVDLVVVPSLGDDAAASVHLNENNIAWIMHQYKLGAEVASLCTGAFLLASAGLLHGKKCSTHWDAAEIFKDMFPEIELTIEKIITDEHGIYTTGGALSSLNLVLHLVEKYYSRETAIYCAKIFEIDLDRKNQSAFIIFSGQKNHEDIEIKKAQQYIEKNFEGKIIVEELCNTFSIERRNFDRRFKKATGNSPLEYMQRVRVEAAKKTLETSRKTINEVMYDVGYTDVKSFREVFKKVTGLSPIEYKHKFNKEAMR